MIAARLCFGARATRSKSENTIGRLFRSAVIAMAGQCCLCRTPLVSVWSQTAVDEILTFIERLPTPLATQHGLRVFFMHFSIFRSVEAL